MKNIEISTYEYDEENIFVEGVLKEVELLLRAEGSDIIKTV